MRKSSSGVPMVVDNKEIYDAHWSLWMDMKTYGPSSRYIRYLMNELLKGLPELEKIQTIIDVGCGEGTNTYFLAKVLSHAQVTGIDFSSTGIACAQLRYPVPNLQFVCDLDSSYLEKRYDLVTCFEVLEHVEDWESLLKRMINAANKYLMLSFPTGRMRDFEKNVGHMRNFQKQEVEKFMHTYGCKPVKVYYSGFPFFSPLYRELCNLTQGARSSFTQGKYGLKQHIICTILYLLFRYCSTKESFGDQFCGLFEKTV